MTALLLPRSAGPRRRAPWARRGAGALLLSAAVHAAAVGTIGGAIVSASSSRQAGHEPEAVDVDVAPPADNETTAHAAQAAPAVHRRLAARPLSRAARTPAAPPAAVTAPRPPDDDVRPARFVLSAGTIATNAPAAVVTPAPLTAGLGPGAGASFAAEPAAAREGDVDVPARLIWGSPPTYPPAASQARIEIDLPLEIVVDASGRVVSARAVTRAGYGLEEAALHGVRAYRFSPAKRAGRAVPVRMRWTVQFRLRG